MIHTIRNIGIHTPIIILTARDSTEYRIRGLDASADDYITKPFAVMDPAAHIISLKGESLSLPRREFSLIEMLLNNIGKVVSRTQIIESLYTWDE